MPRRSLANEESELPEPPGAREDGIRVLLRTKMAEERARNPPPPRNLTFTLQLKCQAGATREPVPIVQRMITRAERNLGNDPVVVGPGPVFLLFNHNFNDPSEALKDIHLKKLRSATVSESGVTYYAELSVITTYRDGGSQIADVQISHPKRPDRFVPLALVPGDNVTSITMVFTV